MLLSKGLCSNTYQQMQPIPASANQNSVSSLHAPAGADERRKVPLLVHVGQTQTAMSSSVGYASQLTRTWLKIPALCTLLCLQAWQGQRDRRAPPAASTPAAALLESSNLGTISAATHTRRDCRCLWGRELREEESFLDVKASLLACWEEPTETAPDGTLPFLLL